MIDEYPIDLYLEDYLRWDEFSVTLSSAMEINETQQNNAHVRMFIQTLSPAQHVLSPPNGPFPNEPAFRANIQALRNALNASWQAGRAITPKLVLEAAGRWNEQAMIPDPGPAAAGPNLPYFLALLKYKYRGCFEWEADVGQVGAFRLWLQGNNVAAEIRERLNMNCFELVFYVAIKARLIPLDLIADIYSRPRAVAPQAGSTDSPFKQDLYDALNKLSVERHLGGWVKVSVAQPRANLQPGDIVMLLLGEGIMHHLGVIIELGPTFVEHKMISLWQYLSGGMTDWLKLGEFLGSDRVDNIFVVRLAGGEALRVSEFSSTYFATG